MMPPIVKEYTKLFKEAIVKAKELMRRKGMSTDWDTFADTDDWFLFRKELKHKNIRDFFELQWKLSDLDEMVQKGPQ